MPAPSILWLRQDLRLHDQPALAAAAAAGAVIPVYVLDDDAPGKWRIGGAQRWWLHHSLAAFGKALEAKGSRLILGRGDAVQVLRELAEETGAEAIHAIRHYEPWWAKAEKTLGERLCLHDGNRLAPPETVLTGSGQMFKVYSAFWRALCERMPPEKPLPVPHRIDAPSDWPAEAVIHTDNPDRLLPAELLTPHLDIFRRPQAKELLITPKGLRLVYQASQADKLHYQVLRQASFELPTLPPELLQELMDRLIALERSIQQAQALRDRERQPRPQPDH